MRPQVPVLLLLACTAARVTPPSSAENHTLGVQHRQRRSAEEPSDVTRSSDVRGRLSRSGRLLSLLTPSPPPPPPAAPFQPASWAFGVPRFDDGAKGGGPQAVYDYSNIRNDMSYYSRTLDMMFKLLLALFGFLLVPVLVPMLFTMAAPWLLETLTDVLAESL